MEKQHIFENSSLSVALRPEDTVQLIPVTLIMKIIKDDKYYDAFTNQFDDNKQLFGRISQTAYAKAIKQFNEAIIKNQYDFNLTEKHYQRMSYIIENYDQLKNNIKDIVEFNGDYEFDISPDKSIKLSVLFQYLEDYRILNKIFNAIDKDKLFKENYNSKEIIYGFSLFLRTIEAQWEELNLDESDPSLYRLLSIVNAFSNQLDDPSCKFPLPEEGIAKVSEKLDIPFLAILLSNKTIPLKIKKTYLTNMSRNRLNGIYEKMEITEKNYLAKELGIWPVDETMQTRVDAIKNYVQNDLIPNLKKIFNGYVPDESYNELLDINLFCNSEGYVYRYGHIGSSLAVNDGNNTTIDIESPYIEGYKLPLNLLIDAITHEAIHNISTKIKYIGSSKIKCTGFKIERKYAGINEAITQYLAETALGDKAYVKLTGKPYCKYNKSVMFINKLVNIGIFNLDELAFNYVNNNVDYLQKAITEYTDITTYNQIIESFNTVNKSEDPEERRLAGDRLDRIIVEIREKVKLQEISYKRS